MDWPYNSKTLNILLGIQISVQLGVSGAIDQVFFKQKHLTPSYHSFQDNHYDLPNKQGDHDNKQQGHHMG